MKFISKIKHVERASLKNLTLGDMTQNVWDLYNISPVIFQAIFTIRFLKIWLYAPCPNRFSYFYTLQPRSICYWKLFSNKDTRVPFPSFKAMTVLHFPQMAPRLSTLFTLNSSLRNYFWQPTISKGHNADRVDSPTLKLPIFPIKLHFTRSPSRIPAYTVQLWNLIHV